MKTVAIIQARMGSTRLPGKVLADLGDGRVMLEHVIERTAAIRGVDRVVVATTSLSEDMAIVRTVKGGVAEPFCGHPTDVLDRYREAARAYQADVIVRITADCPFLDPTLATQALVEFWESRVLATKPIHYLSNAEPRAVADGLDVEVFSRELLEWAWLKAETAFEREHPTVVMQMEAGTLWLRLDPEGEVPPHFTSYRWTVDTVEDLAWARAVMPDVRGYRWEDTIAAIVRTGVGFRMQPQKGTPA